MGEDKGNAVPPWVPLALSVVLALAAFWLAWRYGWPWGAFLLAEGLALAALAVALWRDDEREPWWAYPALFVSLVVLFFSWLYLGGWLKLVEAIQAGSAVVLAFFTITLWRSTQAQAEATRAMKDLQESLAKTDQVPCLFFSVLNKQRTSPDAANPIFEPLLEVQNMSRWGVHVESVQVKSTPIDPKAKEGCGSPRLERMEKDFGVQYQPWTPVGEPPFPLQSGERAVLRLRDVPVTKSGCQHTLTFRFRYAAKPEVRFEAKVHLKSIRTYVDHREYRFNNFHVDGACPAKEYRQ